MSASQRRYRDIEIKRGYIRRAFPDEKLEGDIKQFIICNDEGEPVGCTDNPCLARSSTYSCHVRLQCLH